MSEISLIQSVDNLPIPVEYNGMVENIKTNLPAIQKDANNFYKSSSQFKNITLDVTDLTPISSLKHILAVIDQTRMALQEATISYKRSEIKRDIKLAELEKVEGHEKNLLLLDIQELENQVFNMENSMKGSIRRLNFFVNQYKAILQKLGKTHITEEEYELEENRYHIMTALKQALNAARTRGGVIDEGNHIYLFELGVNGAVAQAEVFKYLQAEEKLIIEGKEPSHEMTMDWLEQCANKFVGSAIKFAESRGFVSLDQESLVKELSNE